MSPASKILGVRVDPVSLVEAATRVEEAVDNRRELGIHLVNSNNFTSAAKDREYRECLNAGALNLPDGWPAVWGSRLLGVPIKERVSGADLCHELFQGGIERGVRHFFYGGTDELLSKLRDQLEVRYPGIMIAGAHAPPFRPLTPDEADDVVQVIDSSGADIVWVGIGTPKQDYWIRDFAPRLSNPKVLIAVGAAFDFLAGEKKRAPLWMQLHGLEWLHRLLSEPRRLWRRYLLGIPQFLFLFSNQIVRERFFRRAPKGH
jgi:N-acetylglucosaminyldiphosphoundecaprenol N-acetyl-beta-D-mannosaminyltransferase